MNEAFFPIGQLHSVLDRAFLGQLINLLGGMPSVHPSFVRIRFEFIECFDDNEWHDDVMLGKRMQRSRIVNEHIDIEDKVFNHHISAGSLPDDHASGGRIGIGHHRLGLGSRLSIPSATTRSS
jgi:hypothetical protein